MGAKGPLIILFLGFGGVAAFGLLAKLVLDESPQAQALMEYREHLDAEFDPTDVEIETTPESTRVTVISSPKLLQAPVDRAEFRTTFLRDFRAIYQPARIPDQLLIVSATSGGGCSPSTEVWRESVDLSAERSAVEGKVVKAFGHPCRIDVSEAGVLRLESAHRGNKSGTIAAVRAAATLWGGGWESVEVRSAGKLKRFTPDGTRVSARPASRFLPNPAKAPPGSTPPATDASNR